MTALRLLTVSRPVMSILLGLAAIVGARIAGAPDSKQQVLLFLLGLTVSSGGFVANDITDRHRDTGASHKPIAQGTLSLRSALLASAALFALGVALAATQGWVVLVIVVAQIALLLSYTPIKTASGFAANLATGAMCGSAFLVGSQSVGNAIAGLLPAIICFMMILPRELVKDVVDIEVDMRHHVRTLPVLYGARTALHIAVVISSIAVAISAGKLAVQPSLSILEVFAPGVLAVATGILYWQSLDGGAKAYLNLTAVAFFLYLGGGGA